MKPFFQSAVPALVDSPNQKMWWHNMPLPDGTRTNGANPDKDLQFKMWNACRIPADGGLAGKRVLDIGANDGFFSIAALQAGASHVVALNSADWSTWPHNVEYAAKAWGVSPEIVTADFRTHPFDKPFDVIFFLGVLYHLEDVFGCMRTLRDLLVDGGVIYLETQMSMIQNDLPIFEYASDKFPTIARQDKNNLGAVGISNYLFPNDAAVRNLAFSYDFECEALTGEHNKYTADHPSRWMYKLTKSSDVAG